jgi:hypothetical protein
MALGKMMINELERKEAAVAYFKEPTISWRDRGNPQKLVVIGGLRSEISTQDLRNTKQEC